MVMGLGLAAINLGGVIIPARFATAVRRFPRNVPLGCVLTLLGTAWFIWNVRSESLADFEAIKPYLYIMFLGVGVGACVFVQDFLAARGAAILLLLLANLMLDTERWADSEWRLVIACWAYLMILAGIWFTVSPWRMRDILHWNTANETRTRLTCGLRVAFGLFVAALGCTVF